MSTEPDLATVAALIGEPTRALILSSLLSGEALPASELALRASITPQTASAHLAKLLEGNLLKVTAVGRHRYYMLKDYKVAQALERLQAIAPLPEPRPARLTRISQDLCEARTCYDHLAGKLGVAVANAFLEQEIVQAQEQDYLLTAKGIALMQEWGIDVDALHKKRRKFAYACLDWSERHFHIAGSLGAAIAGVFLEKGWVKRIPDTRALLVNRDSFLILNREHGIQLTLD